MVVVKSGIDIACQRRQMFQFSTLGTYFGWYSQLYNYSTVLRSSEGHLEESGINTWTSEEPFRLVIMKNTVSNGSGGLEIR